jgi:hypothetical protein
VNTRTKLLQVRALRRTPPGIAKDVFGRRSACVRACLARPLPDVMHGAVVPDHHPVEGHLRHHMRERMQTTQACHTSAVSY